MTCPGTAWVITRFTFPDGTVAEVHAHPNHEPDDVARADALGFPSVDEMTLTHDPMHLALVKLLADEPSPVLVGLAGKDNPPSDLAAAEEAVVLAAQRWLALRRGAA